MSNIFITSDTHFGHAGVCRFLTDEGTKLRPWDNAEDMDEAMIENWNAVVRPKDKTYHLGDVVINRKALKTLSRLNGDKVLIKGNHDLFKLEDYTPYFRDIRGFGALDGFALTHVPIHPASLGRWTGNFHGHLHSNRVMREGRYADDEMVVDEQYLCLCVEHTNFTPIALEDAKKRFEEQQ